MAYLEYIPTKTLFHYTSCEGLNGILESKKIWLSDLRSTNDPREMVMGEHELTKALSELRSNDFQGSRGSPISILAGSLAGYLKSHSIFSASLSNLGDSLPMWREYGANLEGVAIGFKPRAILDMPLRIGQVRYVSEEVEMPLLGSVKEALVNYYDLEDIDGIHRDIGLTSSLASSVVHLKHDSWEYENEIRLSHACDPNGRRVAINQRDIPSYVYEDGEEYFTEVLSRKSDDVAVSYVALPFGKRVNRKHDPSGAISDLVLGPNCHLTVEEVAELVTVNGFQNCTIGQSTCQVR